MLIGKMDACSLNWNHEVYVKNCEETSPLMCSMGFYLCMDESFQNQIKAFRNKTYTDAFKYFNELMKHDFESDKL